MEHMSIIQQLYCLNKEALDNFYESVMANGGEGVMLRRDLTTYEYKRSHLLLKLKPEKKGLCLVVDYQPGLGKHTGRIGALICQWQGKTFKIGTGFSDKKRENPPPIGSMIYFLYTCLSDDGIPMYTRYAYEYTTL